MLSSLFGRRDAIETYAAMHGDGPSAFAHAYSDWQQGGMAPSGPHLRGPLAKDAPPLAKRSEGAWLATGEPSPAGASAAEEVVLKSGQPTPPAGVPVHETMREIAKVYDLNAQEHDHMI